MSTNFTQKEFSDHLNTKFSLDLDGQGEMTLELFEVEGYPKTPEEQQKMERFSLLFRGPRDPQLPQRLYSFKHDQLGQLDLFIVPISRSESASVYEAVFNYFK